jgi:hypothetical protein
MIVPAGVKANLAPGYTDMRKGLVDRRREHRDIIVRLNRQRPTCRQVFVVASRTRVVRCEEARRARKSNVVQAHGDKIGRC